MHLEPALLHGVNHLGILLDGLHPLPHIRLDQPAGLVRVAEPLLVPPRLVRLPELPDGRQPGVDDAEAGVAQRGRHAPAARVPAHDHVLHLEVPHPVHDDALAAQVRGREHVGDVAVHEHVARLEPQHRRLGHPAVGAAEPEDRGLLALGAGREELRVRVGGLLRPVLVSGQVLREGLAVGVGGFCFGGGKGVG